MRYVLLCWFRPGAYAEVKPLREKHYEFLARYQSEIVEGGPLLDDDDAPAGMLMVVDRPSLVAAREFIADEPYTKHGLFESVSIRQWSRVLPEPTPGYVRGELEKERAANAARQPATLPP
jgi:uncharacterized protein